MNRDTATQQQMLNMVDQYNPTGSVVYNQTGETSYTDSQGNVINVPKFTQTTTYTPEQQAIFDQVQQAQSNLAGIATEQSARIKDYLNEPFEFTNRDAETWAYDLASPRILQQQQNEAALRNKLINAGLRPGTAAWNSEMQRLTNANTDQLNMLALTGRQQAFSEALAQRNQPINEITALMSGSQVCNPAAMSGSAPQTGVAGVDYTGLVNQKYQAELQQHQAAMGGLFGASRRGCEHVLRPSPQDRQQARRDAVQRHVGLHVQIQGGSRCTFVAAAGHTITIRSGQSNIYSKTGSNITMSGKHPGNARLRRTPTGKA